MKNHKNEKPQVPCFIFIYSTIFLHKPPHLTSAKTSPKSPDWSWSEFDRVCKRRPQTSAVYLLADPCSGMLKKQYKTILDTNF